MGEILFIIACIIAVLIVLRVGRSQPHNKPHKQEHVHNYQVCYDAIWNVRFYRCECGSLRSAVEIEGPDGPPNPGLDFLLKCGDDKKNKE